MGVKQMSGSRLALVADDPRLASAIGAHLDKALGQVTLIRRFDAVREHLGPDIDGVLVLAAATASDARQVLRLVQEISIQRWPPTILVLAGEAAARAKELTHVEGYVAQELRWPADAGLLTRMVKE